MAVFHILKPALALLICATPVVAENTYSCAGVDPDWQMEIANDSATFSYAEAESLNIPHRTTAAGLDWPKALTLLGGRDTAIVILNERACSNPEITDWPIEANVLTQKGETPVILTGCCITR